MATYSALENNSFTDLVVPFTVYNGIDRVTSGSKTDTEPLTGYTLNSTKFTFTPRLTTLDGTGFGVSLDKMIWDFGDGTQATGYSVEKRYDYPGDYTVTTIFTDQNGVTHRNSRSQLIKVYNYVPDAIQWYTPNIAYPNGGLPEKCVCGRPSDDLTLFRYNSWQSWHMVSGDGGYFINLYSQGSKAQPLEQERYYKSPDIHFTPTWRFVDNKQSTVPLDRVQTDNNTMIYIKIEDGVLVHTTADDPDGEFAGTSGTATVNYIDDNPNRLLSIRPPYQQSGNSPAVYENETMSLEEYGLHNLKAEDKDIILFASFDTSKFPVREYDKELFGFETLKQDYFQIYETQKVGLPMLVKLNAPDHLKITSNGVIGFGITPNKYFNSPISVCVQLADKYNYPINTTQFVELSSQWSTTAESFSAGDVTTDVLTAQGFVSLYLSGADTTFTRIVDEITPYEDFKYFDPGKIIADNPANSYIKIDITERCKSTDPDAYGKDLFNKSFKFTNRTVTVLPKHLDDETLGGVTAMLDSDKLMDLRTIARYWTRRTGEQYYGVLSEYSTYKKPNTYSMDQKSVRIDSKTSGSYSAIVSVEEPDEVLQPESYRLVAETIIDPPLYFNHDVLYYYMANPTYDHFYQIKPMYYRNYTYGNDGFTQTYTSPLTTQTPGNSGMYGFAVSPLGDVTIVDGDTDKIIRNWRNLDFRNEIPIHSLLPESSAYHYPGDPDQYGYSPSSVSFDGNLDYWVTLHDAVSTIKIDGKTNKVIASAVPPVPNIVTDGRNVDPSEYWSETCTYGTTGLGDNQRQGEYGENLIKPTAVETCENNDIVVSYSNPLCSFLVRYDSTGNFLAKADFPGEDRYFTGDICVDVSDHVWAVTDGTGLNADGSVDLGIVKGAIYSFDEEMNYRLHIDSVADATYTDIQTPIPSLPQTITFKILMATDYDYETRDYVTVGFLLESFSPSDINPVLTMYEDNTYIFDNKSFFNKGQHAVVFRNVSPGQEFKKDTKTNDVLIEDDIITQGVSGYDTNIVSIKITKDSPDFIALQDVNFPQNRFFIKVIKKPEYIPRDAETFDAINNPTFVMPDCNNNIWFSWGKRFVSRYNVYKDVIDTTVAIGSAFYDERYDSLDPRTHDRRDNSGRIGAIEAIGMDTANNLLVMNNADKKLYSINSDTISLSSFVNFEYNDRPYSDFQWMDSISNTEKAKEDDFLLPSSYLTDEQIRVFLNNATHTRGIELDEASRTEAYNNYVATMAGENGDITFRTSHGNPGVLDAGLETEYRAGGDWTGFKWINKYDPRIAKSDATTGMVSLTGESDEFILIPKKGLYDVSKVNENIDFAEVMRGFVKQPSLKSQTLFYDKFLNSVFGNKNSDPASLGKRIYERIANFAMNHTDVDTCTLDSLISLAKMTDFKLTEFGTQLPAELSRIIDILSIKYTKLKGTKTNYQNDFQKHGNMSQQTIGVNLGAEIMFVNLYDRSRTYVVGDYVRTKDNRYYEAREDIQPGNIPGESELWRHWPEGHIREQHIEDIKRIFSVYKINNKPFAGERVDDEWIQRKYISQPVIIKLVDRLLIEMDKKFVLREDMSDTYNIVTGTAQTWPEQYKFDMELIDDDWIVASTLSAEQARFDQKARHNEILTDIPTQNVLISIDNDILTVCSNAEQINPTLLIYDERTYFFDVDSPDNGIEFVDSLGPEGKQLPSDFVTGQGKDFGRIILSTRESREHGKIPREIFYRSITDPSKAGMIVVRDISQIKHYSTLYNGVTAYNIDITYNSREQLQRLGWGVNIPEHANAWQHYSIFEYKPAANRDQSYTSGVLDWPDNTQDRITGEWIAPTDEQLKFNQVREFNDWGKDNGIADILIERSLRQGLGLFNGLDTVDDHYK